MRGSRDPVPIARILKDILAKRQPAIDEQLEAVRRAIASAIPASAARRVRATSARGRTVTIEVDHSALLHELRAFRSEAVLAAVRGVAGLESVEKVRFRLGVTTDAGADPGRSSGREQYRGS